jgi:hypothetical protein
LAKSKNRQLTEKVEKIAKCKAFFKWRIVETEKLMARKDKLTYRFGTTQECKEVKCAEFFTCINLHTYAWFGELALPHLDKDHIQLQTIKLVKN